MDSNNIKMYYLYSLICVFFFVKYIICYVEGCNKIKIVMLIMFNMERKKNSRWKRNLLNVVKVVKIENIKKNGFLVLLM